jgi:hypothetical protein
MDQAKSGTAKLSRALRMRWVRIARRTVGGLILVMGIGVGIFQTSAAEATETNRDKAATAASIRFPPTPATAPTLIGNSR